MKKLLSTFIFVFILFFGQISAQSFQNIAPNSQNSGNEQPVMAYPNPAKEFLYLKTSNPNLKIKTTTFYSILGNIVAEMPINASYSEIRVDKLKPGKYLMKYVLNDNTQKVIQIIKQ